MSQVGTFVFVLACVLSVIPYPQSTRVARLLPQQIGTQTQHAAAMKGIKQTGSTEIVLDSKTPE